MEQIDIQTILLIIGTLMVIFATLFAVIWIGWKKEGKRGSGCPYCGKSMRLGADVAFSIRGMVKAFMEEQQGSENETIDFAQAAYCPVTGMIFPNCLAPGEQVNLSWDFIKARCPGTYVSWGSLSAEEQGVLKLLHDPLEGFQMDKSSAHSRPEDVEEDLAMAAPGPLYVDRKEKVLVGWKNVPGTYFQILVVQRPRFQSIEETL